MARRTFSRGRDGRLRFTLSADEAGVLAATARDLSTLVHDPPDDALRDRLYPRAYLDPTEEAAQQTFDAMVHDDLAGARKSALDSIAAALTAAGEGQRGVVEVAVRPDDEEQWMTGLNDARLVLGTMLQVTEDSDLEYDRDDPRFEAGVLYRWLTALLEELLEVLMDDIGEAGTDDPAPS